MKVRKFSQTLNVREGCRNTSATILLHPTLKARRYRINQPRDDRQIPASLGSRTRQINIDFRKQTGPMRRSLLPLALIGLLALPMPGAQAAALTDDLQGLSKQQVEDSVEFAFGNALFFLFHEAGHMLVSEFNLPVLGREEDAVDTLSTLLLLEADGEVFDTALTDSVDGWTFSAEASEAAEEEQALWDVHALDRQRAFSMVCMMVGKDAEKFKESADNLEFPEERRKQCVGEYQKARDSWFGVLKPHQRTDGQNNKFTITYKCLFKNGGRARG
ncbi:hypothetical protein F4V91_15555 [Neorhizobium galegae]|uniref:Uncharacterized protein n=2 Tax=Neorhizobium galegae TaxID=399 RepID=A0A6A1TS86_NEOGA|nr:hypothetical protein F4V91_15555 [Neorhizobium galegae]